MEEGDREASEIRQKTGCGIGSGTASLAGPTAWRVGEGRRLYPSLSGAVAEAVRVTSMDSHVCSNVSGHRYIRTFAYSVVTIL